MRLSVLVILGCLLIFAAEVWDYSHNDADEYLSLFRAFGLSLSNVLGILGLNQVIFAEDIAQLTGFSEVVSGTQTFLGLVLLFLLGLGLRNRFRIK